jgi:molybdopterin-guanine dinucleotide biosynthesis protein A
MPERVVGVLLAGGKSSRMGGGDKCLRELGGRQILARIIERLGPQVTEIVINANGNPSRFDSFRLPVVADDITGYQGPLAGVHAGLHWVKTSRPDADYVVTVAADTPFFPENLVRKLLSARDKDSSFRIAESDKGTHPVIGLWPMELAEALEHSLRRGERKVTTWTKDHGAQPVFFSEIEVGGRKIDPFFNINAPEDLAEAEGLLSGALQ